MMTATKEDIRHWISRAKTAGAVHLLIVCDTFDYKDYPRALYSGESALEIARTEYGYPGEKNMQRVIECYDLAIDVDTQLSELRALHFDKVAP